MQRATLVAIEDGVDFVVDHAGNVVEGTVAELPVWRRLTRATGSRVAWSNFVAEFKVKRRGS